MNRGFSIIEILIAMAIMTIVVSGVVVGSGGFGLALSGNQSTIQGGETNAEAVRKAQQVIEQSQALGRTDFNLVNSQSTTTDGIYKKSVSVELLADYVTKKVTTFVAWVGDHGQALSTTLTTFVTNLENVNSPDTCSSTLSNTEGWKTPQHQVYDFGQLGVNGNDGNGFGVSDIQVLNKKLYVAMYVTPNTDKDTLFVFTIPTDPTTQPPVFLDSVDNASVDPGLNAIAVASTTSALYVYAANSYGADFNTCVNVNGTSQSCAQLQVFNVTNPANIPAPIESYKLSTTSPALVKGSGGQAVGKSIFYKNGYIYLGLTKTLSGPEFNVIDVGGGGLPASPTNPMWKGGYSVGNDVNSIFVKGKYAYLASPNAENLKIIDIDVTSATFMQKVGSYSPTNAPESEGVGSDHGESVAVIGNTAYLGRTYGSTEFYALNTTVPASVTTLGSQNLGTGNATSVYGMAVRDYLGFFVTKSQFQVWNLSTFGNIVPWTQSGTSVEFSDSSHAFSNFGSGGAGTSADCEGDYVYTSLASTQGNTKDSLAVLFPGTPPFDYTLSAAPASLTFTKASPGTETVTVTKVGSAAAQLVTLTLSSLPSNVSAVATPLSAACTPTSGTCTVTFTLSISNNAHRTGTVTVTGSSPAHTTTFGVVAN